MIKIADEDNDFDLRSAGKLTGLVCEVYRLASIFNYEWDKKAIDWPRLNSNSIVVEIGGFTGRWSLQIAQKYNPNLYIFEPQKWCCLVLQEVFREYKAKIYPYGLAIDDGEQVVYEYGTDGCTLNPRPKKTRNNKSVVFKEIKTAFWEEQIRHIDLMLMNIEGYEFDLIPHMLDNGILPDVLMVQFHGERMQETRTKMMEFYSLIWDYGEALSAWRRK